MERSVQQMGFLDLFRPRTGSGGRRLRFCCLTHMGLARSANEDNYAFFGSCLLPDRRQNSAPAVCDTWERTNPAAAVFDGMGGGVTGKLASYEAASFFAACQDGRPWDEDRLAEAVREMNRRVRGMKERERSASAGTTALLFAVSDGDALICFLGDSPAFLLREGELRRLTRPHNDAELLRKLKIPGRRPSLTRYLGIEESGSAVRPEFVRIPLCTGDRFLLCTDGLTNMVAENKIREIMTAEAESGSCAGVLLKEALSAGGRDNITIVLCDVGS